MKYEIRKFHEEDGDKPIFVAKIPDSTPEDQRMRFAVMQALKKGVGLAYANLAHADLSYLDLRGWDFRHANLEYSNLRGAMLGGVGLDYANLSHANINEANLEESNLTGANLTHAILVKSRLPKARLAFARIDRADFSFSNLIKANLKNADMRGIYLRNAFLDAADLTDVKMLNANATGASFNSAVMDNIILDGSDLSYAHFDGVDLMRINSFSAVRGNNKEFRIIQLGEIGDVVYTATHMQIGRSNKPIEDWLALDGQAIDAFNRVANKESDRTSLKKWDGYDISPELWDKYKLLIQSFIEISPATPYHKQLDVQQVEKDDVS